MHTDSESSPRKMRKIWQLSKFNMAKSSRNTSLSFRLWKLN